MNDDLKKCEIIPVLGLVLARDHAIEIGILKALTPLFKKYKKELTSRGFSDGHAAEILTSVTMFPDLAAEISNKTREVWEAEMLKELDKH